MQIIFMICSATGSNAKIYDSDPSLFKIVYPAALKSISTKLIFLPLFMTAFSVACKAPLRRECAMSVTVAGCGSRNDCGRYLAQLLAPAFSVDVVAALNLIATQ